MDKTNWTGKNDLFSYLSEDAVWEITSKEQFKSEVVPNFINCIKWKTKSRPLHYKLHDGGQIAAICHHIKHRIYVQKRIDAPWFEIVSHSLSLEDARTLDASRVIVHSVVNRKV